ncbi:hypothetical protein OESDEN_00133 [Oesophagostomum dentatum]|uniref:Uncharacterized protein n=1 Tax=Oesophagostomum dentatum TaxID=61180 RepID=A0A0B1TRF0_OESDE|nr:hypothetical protein OESDEN_00133 [Oesophagostomum dentatum]
MNDFTDPLPSFLESLHKQQHLVPEPPRKKSKRPSRSKADGKLTPEEEERAKQKICSIIDSVYSETARRMGDSSKRSLRNPNLLTSSTLADSSKRVCEDTTTNFNNNSVEEEHHHILHGEAKDSFEESPDTPPAQLNGHPNPSHGEDDKEEAACSSASSSSIDYGHILNRRQAPACDDTKPDQTSYHSFSSFAFDAGLAYSANREQGRSLVYEAALASSQAYDVCFDRVQHTSYSIDASDRDQSSRAKNFDYGVPPGESTPEYGAACSPTLPSSRTGCESVNPEPAAEHDKPGGSTQSVRHVAESSKDCSEQTSHSNIPLRFERTATSPHRSVDGEKPSSVTGNGDVRQPAMKTKVSTKTAAAKQDTTRSTSNGLPLPNYIPYRMIAVENPKPVEVITIDSGDETSSPKLMPKRRRKYKYVVESVLDNVPYTFRQAESDDDESTEKHSTSVSTSTHSSN